MKSRKTAVKSRDVVARAPTDILEVLDRVLDRGIVIDAWLRVSVIGLKLVDVDARIVVASLRTYVQEHRTIADVQRALPPPEPAPAPAPRPATRARRARRPARAKARLACAHGCTFLRVPARNATVACPGDRSRRCAVTLMG